MDNVVMQPRCVHCGIAHPGPAVMAISYGHAPCAHCGRTPQVYTDEAAYRDAVRRVRDANYQDWRAARGRR